MGATSLLNVTWPAVASVSESAPSAADCVMHATDTTKRIERPIRMVPLLPSDDSTVLFGGQLGISIHLWLKVKRVCAEQRPYLPAVAKKPKTRKTLQATPTGDDCFGAGALGFGAAYCSQ